MLDDYDILITGGTGSFGRAMVRYLLAQPGTARIIVFSRDELKQHQMQQELVPGDWGRMRFFVGDVRNQARLETALHDVRYVIHAAAMKQVPACEYNPTEAVATNVIGAMNLASAAINCGVHRVLALSTDKAVAPVNLYGATKLCAEKIFLAANAYGGRGTRFSCVRYGNVLGSRGSVLQVWRERIAAGKKVLLTDPGMTRFWISLNQAVHFVHARLDSMQGEEVFVPKLPSVSMIDLATALHPDGGWDRMPVRPGEKTHETLIAWDESHLAAERDDHYELAQRHTNPSAAKFAYASNTNKNQLSGHALEMLLQEIP